MENWKVNIIGIIVWSLIFWALIQIFDEANRQPTDERYDYDTREAY